MKITISSVSDLGLALRAARRSSKVRLDDMAATAGVSKQFASDVEYGKPTVQLGLVFKLLAELGIPVMLDIPEEAAPELASLRLKGGLRLQKRRSSVSEKQNTVVAQNMDSD